MQGKDLLDDAIGIVNYNPNRFHRCPDKIFSYKNRIEVEMNNRNISGKIPKYLKLNNILPKETYNSKRKLNE